MSALSETVTPAIARSLINAAAQGPLGANPRVGAALVSPRGEVLSLGYHRGAGTAHAEADAINRAYAAGKHVEGATCIVTLEPCAHDGRTPSCARSLIKAGIARVVYAIADPHAKASGGVQLLHEAGIDVCTWREVFPEDVGLELTRAAYELNWRWFTAKREGRPFVTAKIAQTLDSKVAAENGESQWITGAAARAEGHALRAVVDAIAVGTGTLAADDPALTARTLEGTLQERQPLRVVIGATPVPAEARVRGADGLFLHMATRNLQGVLHELARKHRAEHVLIEGGPTLVGAALAADLVDDLWIHQAPTVLGSGTAAIPPLGINELAERRDLTIIAESVRLVGKDLVFHAMPAIPSTCDAFAETN